MEATIIEHVNIILLNIYAFERKQCKLHVFLQYYILVKEKSRQVGLALLNIHFPSFNKMRKNEYKYKHNIFTISI